MSGYSTLNFDRSCKIKYWIARNPYYTSLYVYTSRRSGAVSSWCAWGGAKSTLKTVTQNVSQLVWGSPPRSPLGKPTSTGLAKACVLFRSSNIRLNGVSLRCADTTSFSGNSKRMRGEPSPQRTNHPPIETHRITALVDVLFSLHYLEVKCHEIRISSSQHSTLLKAPELLTARNGEPEWLLANTNEESIAVLLLHVVNDPLIGPMATLVIMICDSDSSNYRFTHTQCRFDL